MNKLSTKQLQLTGVGIIREDLLKKTIHGNVYEATLYYEDKTVKARILYKRNGKGIVLEPDSREEYSNDYYSLLKELAPKVPQPDHKTLAIIKRAIGLAITITIYNQIINAPSVFKLIVQVIDIAIIIMLIAIYRREKEVYVKVWK